MSYNTGEAIFNTGALGEAQEALGGRNSLEAMKTAFAQVASAPGMFGDVPNAGAASAALESAATAMLEELDRAGVSIADMMDDARQAADIAESTDEAMAAEANGYEPPPGVMGPHEADTQYFAGYPGAAAFDNQMFGDSTGDPNVQPF